MKDEDSPCVEVTPTATGGGATVTPNSGTLYGGEVPVGSPAVALSDANGLVATLYPGVPRDFTHRPRPFTGPLTALAAGALGITSILLDLD